MADVILHCTNTNAMIRILLISAILLYRPFTDLLGNIEELRKIVHRAPRPSQPKKTSQVRSGKFAIRTNINLHTYVYFEDKLRQIEVETCPQFALAVKTF